MIGYIHVADIINLWVEVGDDLLGAHCVDLVLQVGHGVEVLAAGRRLSDRRDERRLEQAVGVQCEVLCDFGQLSRRLLLTCLGQGAGMRPAQFLQVEQCLRLD